MKKNNIPLLLSKSSLKRCNSEYRTITIEYRTIFDTEINLLLSTRGHFCFDIKSSFAEVVSIKEVLLLESHLSSYVY